MWCVRARAKLAHMLDCSFGAPHPLGQRTTDAAAHTDPHDKRIAVTTAGDTRVPPDVTIHIIAQRHEAPGVPSLRRPSQCPAMQPTFHALQLAPLDMTAAALTHGHAPMPRSEVPAMMEAPASSGLCLQVPGNRAVASGAPPSGMMAAPPLLTDFVPPVC